MLAIEGANEEEKAKAARQRAEQLAEKVVALKPQDAMAQSTLATLYAQDKESEKALSKIRTSLALAPDDPSVLSSVGEACSSWATGFRHCSILRRRSSRVMPWTRLSMIPTCRR